MAAIGFLVRLAHNFTTIFKAKRLWLLGLFLLLGCSADGGSWAAVQARGTLRVGLDPTFPPFEVATESDLFGLDVDLARALGESLGVEVEFVYFGYDGLYDALLTKQVDVLISALVVQLERTRDFSYSEPYFNAGQVLITAVSPQSPNEMADLAGATVAVELGSLGHLEALDWQKRLPDLTVVTVTEPDAAVQLVLNGEAEAAIVDGVNGRLFMQGQPTLRRSQEPVTVEPYAIVTRAEDGRLLEEVNRALAEMEENGRLQAIVTEWLGP